MKSRVHPKYKTKYRVRNWASYERALIGRGNITIWLSRAAIAAWKPEGTRTRGAPPKYSDLAIETALTLRLLFHLPLRQAEGFLTSLFHLMGLDLRSPDHTTLSRRGQHLNLTLRRVPRRAALHLFILALLIGVHVKTLRAAARDGRLPVTYDTRTTFRRLRARATTHAAGTPVSPRLLWPTGAAERTVVLPLTWASVPERLRCADSRAASRARVEPGAIGHAGGRGAEGRRLSMGGAQTYAVAPVLATLHHALHDSGQPVTTGSASAKHSVQL